MKTYQEKKKQARQFAIEWQQGFEQHNYDYYEIKNASKYFYKLGKRYGLLKEFRENGII